MMIRMVGTEPAIRAEQALMSHRRNAPTPEVISILELVDKAPPQSYEYLSKDTDALMARIHIPYQTLWYILIILAVVIAIITAISFLKKLLYTIITGSSESF